MDPDEGDSLQDFQPAEYGIVVSSPDRVWIEKLIRTGCKTAFAHGCLSDIHHSRQGYP